MEDVIHRHFLLCIALIPLLAPAVSASQEAKANQLAGARLFQRYDCGHCHGTDLSGTPKGPALMGIGMDKLWPAEKMTQQILLGGVKMPPFGDSLTDEEIGQIVAYLRGARPSNAK
jgi:mono/diheme cytochrome c family protein